LSFEAAKTALEVAELVLLVGNSNKVNYILRHTKARVHGLTSQAALGARKISAHCLHTKGKT
jgi:hypothetical protein